MLLRRSFAQWACAAAFFAACSSTDRAFLAARDGGPAFHDAGDVAVDPPGGEPSLADAGSGAPDGDVATDLIDTAAEPGGLDSRVADVADVALTLDGQPGLALDTAFASGETALDGAGDTAIALDAFLASDRSPAPGQDAPTTLAIFDHCATYDHAQSGDGAHDVAVLRVLFTPGGSHLISFGTDGRAKVWQITPTGLAAPASKLELKGDGWLSGAIRGDGTYLATGDDGGVVTIYDFPASVAAGAAVIVASLPVRGSSARPRGFTTDGNHLAVSYSSHDAGKPNQVVVWDIATRTAVQVLDLHSDSDYPMAFLLGDYSASMWMASEETVSSDASLDTVVTLVDMAKLPTSKVQFTIPGADAYSMAFSPDGSTLAIGFGDGEVSLWNIRNKSSIAAGNSPDSLVIAGGSANNWANVMAFSADGNYLVTAFAGYSPCAVTLSSLSAPRQTLSKGLEYDGTAIDISPDGLSLAVGENNNGRILYCAP